MLRQFCIHQPGHYRDERVMMNGVSDGINEFSPKRGAGDGRIAVGVTDFAARPHLSLQCAKRESLQLSAHLFGEGECETRLRLDAHITLVIRSMRDRADLLGLGGSAAQ